MPKSLDNFSEQCYFDNPKPTTYFTPYNFQGTIQAGTHSKVKQND